jgi:hypothetical protein
MELPYVQKLSEQMKESKDALVLTVNIDEELGLVEPFIKENKYTFTVIPAQSYAEGLGVYSIPRNWVVSANGKLTFEGIGFGGDGEEWTRKAKDMISEGERRKLGQTSGARSRRKRPSARSEREPANAIPPRMPSR